MCDQCRGEILNFRARSTVSPWKLDRKLMADRLEEILANPDTIQQGALGLCGVAAFLRAWILNDHLAVARFAIELYEHGKAKINDYEASPCEDLLDCNYATINWGAGNGIPCPPAEWMIMSALQDEENFWFDYEGTPDSSDGQTYGEVSKWFEATNLYAKVDEQFPLIPVDLPYNTPGINHLLGLRPDDDTDVVLNIHSKLMSTPDSGFFAFYNNNIPNHYIALCSPATRVVEAGVEKVRFNYFTWGAVTEGTFTKADFEDAYYGALVADAKTFKKPLAPLPATVPLAPHHLTLSVTGNKVKLSWQCSSLHVTSYVIERRSVKSGAMTWSITGVPRPSTLGATCEDTLPNPPESEYYYRVKAVNAVGASEFSSPVMLSLPAGTVREIHYWDADIALLPMHARQFTVVRAPVGLVPAGYARFPAPTCDCRTPQVVYDARWESDGMHARRLNKATDKPFKPGRAAYLFIRFGTGAWADDVRMDGGPVTAKLIAHSTATPATTVSLTLNPGAGGTYYWGVFTPENRTQTTYLYSVEITAQDSFARFGPRTPLGNVLDANPATAAYVDQSAPPYQFMNYEPGTDRNHGFHIGFVRTQLAADSLEINNDFARATAGLSAAGDTLAQWQVFENLTLGDANDMDYFALQFAPSQKDRDCQLLQPATVSLSGLLGLSQTFYPPGLLVSLTNSDLDCLDLTLFTSDAQGRMAKHSAQGMYRLTVWNPLRAGYPDARLYAMVKNGNYAVQGAINYGVTFSYSHAAEEFNVDTNAPAYQGRTTAARIFLKELYEKIDLPRPGDDLRQRFSHDSRATLTALSKLLVDPATSSALRQILGRDVRADLAVSCASTAEVAVSLGMAQVAEDLHKAALVGYEALGDRLKQRGALEALARFYDRANEKSKAAAMRKRISLVQRTGLIKR